MENFPHTTPAKNNQKTKTNIMFSLSSPIYKIYYNDDDDDYGDDDRENNKENFETLFNKVRQHSLSDSDCKIECKKLYHRVLYRK